MKMYEYYIIAGYSRKQFVTKNEAIKACNGNQNYIKKVELRYGVSDKEATLKKYNLVK